MAATYLPDADDGLSAAALALTPERLESEALAAEVALGLFGVSLTGDRATVATRAVALQVNLQVRRRHGTDVVSESKGGQSLSYAKVNGQRVAVDAEAQGLVASLLGSRPRSGVTELQSRW